MRREFRLPEADEEHLDALGSQWETVCQGSVNWLLIHDFPVPAGYNHATVTAAIRIDGGYPPGQLDMVYFFPELRRTDGKTIGASQHRQQLDASKSITSRANRPRALKNFPAATSNGRF